MSAHEYSNWGQTTIRPTGITSAPPTIASSVLAKILAKKKLKSAGPNPGEFETCTDCAPTSAWVDANSGTYADDAGSIASLIGNGGLLSAVKKFLK